jgi:hypothetical protein
LIHVRDNYYFIPSFVKFQYPKGLSEKQTVPIHRPEPEDTFITTPITGDDL